MSELNIPANTDILHTRMAADLRNATSPYAQKDLRKAKGATKFIGRGSLASSTNRYMMAAGNLANCGEYQATDVIFVSAEGARRGRVAIDKVELQKAVNAGATFITDNEYDRTRTYNVGEREVSAFLLKAGYNDKGSGRWKKI